MERTRLLLVDDDDVFRNLLSRELGRRGYEVLAVESVRRAKYRIENDHFELAVVDLRLADGDGLELLRLIRSRHPDTETVMLTGHGTIDSAVEAIRMGAFDYLRKPCPLDELEVTLHKASERRALVERASILSDGFSNPDLGADVVGVSPAFVAVRDMIERVAASDATTLVLGETGVGKEVVARLIHARSPRARKPLVVVDCTTLHDALLESELFGHEKGAYTGATERKHGLFEVADGGTIFLDEVGDVSPQTQVRLLRVLETGRFRHVGGTREISVDVRIVAATNRDLEDMMRRGFLRSDLYYRLCTIRIDVPPLRDRAEDIPVLALHFLARLNARFGKARTFSAAALDALRAHSWPGNVRELLHAVERAMVLCDGAEIGPQHLPRALTRVAPPPDSDRLESLRTLERRHIVRVLDVVEGNRSAAASILGIAERTLYRKIRGYGLDD